MGLWSRSLLFFLRDTWRTPVREALVTLVWERFQPSLCVRDGCRDACRPMFSSEIFSAGLGDCGFGRVLCCDVCRDGRLLRPVEALPFSEWLGPALEEPGDCCDDGCDVPRLVEALPLSERLGHTMLWFLEGFAAFAYKMSEAALLGWGMRENIRLLTMFEVASLALEDAEFGWGK